MESGYYPPGAEFDSNAPWNQIDLPKKEIEVTVSVTLSKTVKAAVVVISPFICSSAVDFFLNNTV